MNIDVSHITHLGPMRRPVRNVRVGKRVFEDGEDMVQLLFHYADLPHDAAHEDTERQYWCPVEDVEYL